MTNRNRERSCTRECVSFQVPPTRHNHQPAVISPFHPRRRGRREELPRTYPERRTPRHIIHRNIHGWGQTIRKHFPMNRNHKQRGNPQGYVVKLLCTFLLTKVRRERSLKADTNDQTSEHPTPACLTLGDQTRSFLKFIQQKARLDRQASQAEESVVKSSSHSEHTEVFENNLQHFDGSMAPIIACASSLFCSNFRATTQVRRD